LLPLIYTCEYVYIYPRVSGIHSGFGYPYGFWVSSGLVLVMDFQPNWCSILVRISVLGARRPHPIRTRPVAILSSRGSGYCRAIVAEPPKTWLRWLLLGLHCCGEEPEPLFCIAQEPHVRAGALESRNK
jgi:hypothetical protein